MEAELSHLFLFLKEELSHLLCLHLFPLLGEKESGGGECTLFCIVRKIGATANLDPAYLAKAQKGGT